MKNKKNLIPCPKCLGGGDLPGKRLNHPSLVSPRKCWLCQGEKMITKERAIQYYSL